MFTKIESFNNEEFGEVRTLTVDGNPWFVGRDVAKGLGYANPKDAMRKHVDPDDKQIIKRSQFTTFSIPARGLTVINESGLYALIFGSKLESAKRFKHWVTAEVLPKLRKTGSYAAETTLPTATETAQITSILSTDDKNMLAYNRGIVLGVLRHELDEDSTLEIFNRLSAHGKNTVMKIIFGEVRL